MSSLFEAPSTGRKGLFEAPPLKPAGGIKDSTAPVGHAFGLEHMDVGELLALRAEIDGWLPAMSLKDLNLEEELVRQFLQVKALQTQVMNNDEIPANQLAQVAGQVGNSLQALVKMQADYYNIERFKGIEGLMIKHMKKLPLEVATKFVEEYENLGVKDGS